MTTDRLLLAELLTATADGQPVAMATVIATDRSVPRHAGSKMLVYADGRQSGTVGGGEMEARVVAEAAGALADGRTRVLEFALVDPAAGDPGVCGGTMTVYVEPHMPDPMILVVGCGHVGRAVIDLAHWLGYRVVAVDDRDELARAEEIPGADLVIGGDLEDAISKAGVNSSSHVVLVTRNTDVDVAILPLLLETSAASIGVMGSARRWEATRAALLDAGIAAAAIESVHAPIGIELHAETPEEIALSVLSEIVRLRRTPAD